MFQKLYFDKYEWSIIECIGVNMYPGSYFP